MLRDYRPRHGFQICSNTKTRVRVEPQHLPVSNRYEALSSPSHAFGINCEVVPEYFLVYPLVNP